MARAAARPLQHQLLGVALLAVLAALLVAVTVLVINDVRDVRRNLELDLDTQSELLVQMSAPALVFDDRNQAADNLSLLRLRPHILAAALYAADGRLVASYIKPGETVPLPPAPAIAGLQQESGRLAMVKRVGEGGERLGAVYLRAEYDLAGVVAADLAVALAASLVAVLVAWAVTRRLARVMTAPLREAAEVAGAVVDTGDFSRRAPGADPAGDEVARLAAAFNRLLAETEARTGALQESNRALAAEGAQRELAQREVMRLNQELEQRVQERTVQLEAAYAELELAMAEVNRASAAKTAFLSSMSHELRTPLNAILGFAQILASDKLPTTLAQKKEFANHICKSGRHLLALINEILDLAKIEAGGMALELGPVALDQVLRECQDMLAEQAAQRGIAMVFPPACRSEVWSDRTRLRQILLNLLSNAIKYNREHGAVMVDCDASHEGWLRVTVQDTGPGLTPEQLRQLFQPFNRLGQEGGAQEGTGIGLVLTRRLVELMGGRIGVNSAPGAGSSFWIELEAAGSAAARPCERMEVGT